MLTVQIMKAHEGVEIQFHRLLMLAPLTLVALLPSENLLVYIECGAE
jgi:hypothetical protein